MDREGAPCPEEGNGSKLSVRDLIWARTGIALKSCEGDYGGCRENCLFAIITYNRNYCYSLLIVLNINVFNNIKHSLKICCVPKTVRGVLPSSSHCYPHFILQLRKLRF